MKLAASLGPILAITFIDILGFSILIPILPFYVRHFGASTVTVGALFATFALFQFIGGPVWGNVSDRIGRKTVLVISQIGATVGWTMLAFAPSIVWVFVARIIEGFSGGNISVTQAYVSDRVEAGQRAAAFGLIGAAFSAGLVVGPAAGGYLLAHDGYRVPFLLAAALQVVTLLATIFFLPESVAAHGTTAPEAGVGDIPKFLAMPTIAPVLVQKLAFSLGLYGWFSSFALVLAALLGFGPTETSYYFAAFGVVSVVMQLGVVGRLSDRFGARTTSNIGLAAAVAFFLFIPFAHTIGMAAIGILLFSFALSLNNATLPALLANASPENVRGTVLGVGSSMDGIAGILMPTISTAVLSAYGPTWTAAISAIFSAVALALGLRARLAPRAA